jgi:O-phosphoseryl-tRNA synthetase
MGKFDVRKIRAEAERNFEKAWMESAQIIDMSGHFFSLQNKPKAHPLFEIIERSRHALLELGFTETVVPSIVERQEIQKQYGPESAVILDRIFFLAGLERPDIGISQKKIKELRKIVPGFSDKETIQSIFRKYNIGEIDADDLVEVLMKELKIREDQATAILSIFSEFKELKPVPMDLTLRSHTTAGWFAILSALKDREPLPIQLFTVGPKFRREQRLDESHLYESWTASIVIMAERMSMEDGERITRGVMEKLGFKDFKIEKKKATSKYYAPQTEFEIFVRHPKTGEFVEVGDGGFYSPVALSNYDIPYPTFNLGIGLERLLMVETGEPDIRAIVFPHIYKKLAISDVELSRMVRLGREPSTDVGRKIAEAISEVSRQHADEPSPCEFKAFEGEIYGRKVLVKVVEPESGTKLGGPAGFHEVYVYDGNIVGLPPKGWKADEFLDKVRERGVSTGIKFIDAFSALAASEIEKASEKGERHVKIRVRNVKLPSDINIVIDRVAQNYITSRNKRVDIRGPVFTTVVADFS